MSLSNQKYHFNQWIFDPIQDQLTNISDSSVTKIEPQVAALLILLIKNSDEVLSKEQLSAQLWPNTVVEENSVYQLLTKLRKILQDPPKQPKIIKTFPKKGYRFIAQLIDTQSIHAPETIINPAARTENNQLSSISSPVFFSSRVKVLSLLCLVIGFSAIAFFSKQTKEQQVKQYISEDITTELGLESWPAPHPSDNSLAYIKDAQQLWLKAENKTASLLINDEGLLSNVSWDDEGKRLAFWRVDINGCAIIIVDQQGKQLSRSANIDCQRVARLIWLDDQQIIALYREKSDLAAFQYNIIKKEFTEIPLLKQSNEHLRTAVKAWHDEIYYILIDADYTSRLINQQGDTLFQWQFPVKFAAFDSKNQRLLINDESKHLGLYSIGIEGDKQSIAQTARGVFSTIAADKQGNFYTTVENWQVNIRDKDNLPIFSSTSLDYLPVSNALGETTFMSRRGGFCQIYLHVGGKVSQLSQYKSYDTVKFLQWSPDLALILTNRDNKAYIYNRKGLVQSFPLVTKNLPVSFGWLTNEKIYSFDGEYLRYYQLSGQKVAEFKVTAEQLYYQVDQKTWWLYNPEQLSSVKGELLNTEQLSTQRVLSMNQSRKVSGIRLVENNLYWKSQNGQQDTIWQLALKNINKNTEPVIVKSGKFIWNYDVNSNNEITVAIKENIDGNIRFYHP